MSYSPKDLFPDWYRIADITLDDKIITYRMKAIKKIIAKTDADFWIDIVKLHFGIKPKDSNKEEFIYEFRATDATFPLIDNENVIKCLASIALCFKLEKDVSNLGNVISLALLNTNIFRQFTPFDHIPVYSFAKDNLLNIRKDELVSEDAISKLEEIKERLTPEEQDEDEENNTDKEPEQQISNEDQIEIINTVQSLASTNLKLLEETNVLWWIFGEYTTITNEHFKDAGSQKMIIIAAKELSDLIQVSIGISSAEQLLSRVLQISNGGKVSTKKCTAYETIKAFDDDFKNKVLNKDKKGLTSEVTPCLTAVIKSIGFAEGENWTEQYKRSNYNADIEREFDYLTLSYQFYREFIYLKLLKAENA